MKRKLQFGSDTLIKASLGCFLIFAAVSLTQSRAGEGEDFGKFFSRKTEIKAPPKTARLDETPKRKQAAITIMHPPSAPPSGPGDANCVNATEIGGIVFRDYNADGTRDATASFFEHGISGIAVAAYDADDAPGSPSASTTSGASGAYLLTGLSSGTTYRLEFSWTTSWLQPGAAGGTNLQFATTGSCDNNFGVNNPADYCQSDPTITTNCYVEHNQTSGANSTLPVLVSTTYSAGNASATVTGVDSPSPSMISAADSMGSTWGLAYQRSSQTLFAAAFMKRHCGLGPDTTGAIYKVDIETNAVSTFVDLNDLFGAGTVGEDTHPFNTPTGDILWQRDAYSWDAVGKVAFGDIDISEDELHLWAINLANRKLYKIPLGSVDNPVSPVAGDIDIYPASGDLTGIGGFATSNPATDIRPFGLGVKDGYVYVGFVSTAESTQQASDLRAYVYRFDPVAETFTKVLDFPLDYPRGNAVSNGGSTHAPAEWNPWKTTFTVGSPVFGSEYAHPQPILSDIVFENGNMIIGLRDRFGDQMGYDQLHPTTGSTLYRGDSAGDILKASPDGSGGWTIEKNAQSDPAGTFGPTAGANNNQGPATGNSGEFYHQDRFPVSGSTIYHDEVAVGGLLQIPGFPDVATTQFDPVDDLNTAFDGGIFWMSNSTGNRSRGYRVFDGGTGSNDPYLGKANGLGDLEAFCDAAPIEVGNLVWNDTDGDGVQDPDETGLDGVAVKLFKSGNEVASTTTADGGKYGFSNAASGSASGIAYGVTDLLPGMSYEIRIENAEGGSQQGVLSGMQLTTANNGGGDGQADLRDSDGILGGSTASISFSTGAAGWNRHIYDFGFREPCDVPNFSIVIAGGTCNGSVPANDASIVLSGVTGADQMGVSTGATYTGAPYGDPSNSDLTDGGETFLDLPPNQTYTFRIWSGVPHCYLDTTLSTPSLVCAFPDLELDKSASPAQVALGQSVSFILKVKNTGTGGATGVEVTDALPACFSFFSASGDGSFVGNTWTIGSIAAGDSAVISLTGTAVAEGICYNTAEVSLTNEPDTDSTPGNGVESEDDIDRSCFTVPYELCPGGSLTATIPSGYTNVQWYHDNQTISGATNDTLIITLPGSYTFTADQVSCPVEGCCPIVAVVASIPNTPEIAIICDDESYLFGGEILNASGVYIDTLTGQNGCDSVVTLTLTVLPHSVNNLSVSICNGESYFFDGQNLTSAGTYVDTLTAENGCDSVATLNLTVLSHSTANFSTSICDGESFLFGTQNLTSTGTFIDTLPSANGCDSVVTLNLTVLPHSSSSLNISICDGESYDFYGEILTSAGTYTDTLIAANTCDSVVTLTLTVLPTAASEEFANICPGESFEFAGQELTSAGIYHDTLSAENGCDSVVTLTLTVLPTAATSLSASICDGDSYIFGTQNLSLAGNYVDSLFGQNGCDSVVTLTLTVLPHSAANVSASVCDGETYFFAGQNLSIAGFYNDTLTAANGCDSVVTLALSILPHAASTFSASICDGETYFFAGQNLSIAGFYNDTLTAANGCDSVVTLALSILPHAASTFSASICDGESYFFAGQNLSIAGFYNDTLTAANGCDSVVTLALSILPHAASTFSAIICDGESYFFAGQNLSIAGFYNDTLTAANGCDSVVTLDLSLHPTYIIGTSAEICQGETYSFGGQGLTASGVYFDTLSTINGCDSILQLSLDVLQHAATSISASICDGESYFFDGQNLTSAGTYSDTLAAANGCDSLLTLTLDVVPPVVENLDIQICNGNSYFFDGQNLVQAGNYTDTLTAAGGCDSIVNLALTVVDAVQTNLSASICDGESYFFDGQNLNLAGIYADTLTSAGGCDSIVTLTLSSLPHAASSLSASICTGDSFLFGTQFLNSAGTYSDTLAAANGCDSVATLVLTVLQHAQTDLGAATICQGEGYDFNGQTLTVAGNYTDTLTAANGCDSVVLFELAVLPISQSPLEAEICDGESYDFNGQILTQSGTYTDTLTADNGCDSVLIFTLIVFPLPAAGSDVTLVCNGGNAPDNYDFNVEGGWSVVSQPAGGSAQIDGFGNATGLTLAGNYVFELTQNGCSDTVNLTVPVCQQLLSLGDLVFEDADNNGIFNVGDSGLAGVQVQAWEIGLDGIKGTGDDELGGAATTDNNGIYSIGNLPEGLYYVKLTGVGIPAGYVSSTGDGVTDNDGSGFFEPYLGTDNNQNFNDDGTQMGAMVMSDTVRLTLNGEPISEDGNPNTNLTVDFGLYLPQAPPPAALGDFVWYDLDQDGQQDLGESGIEGVEVELWSPGGDGVKGGGDDVLLALDTTDADGLYIFDNLPAGEYFVQFDLGTLPSNYTPTTQDNGADISDSDGDATGGTDIISLEPGETNYSIDFGVFEQQIFDLALIKQLSAGQSATVEPGDTVSYTITVFNQGNVFAFNIEVRDSLPAFLNFDAALNPAWTANGDGSYSATIGALAGSLSTTLTLKAIVSGAATDGLTLRNLAEIHSADDDGDPGDSPADLDSSSDDNLSNDNEGGDDVTDNSNGDEDDHDGANVEVNEPGQPVFDLALRKRLVNGQPQFFKLGDQIHFTLTVFNQGTVNAFSVQVVDYLPNGLSNDHPNWLGTTGTISTGIPFLAAGDSVDIPLTVKVTSSFNHYTQLVNYAEINGADDDTNIGNAPPTDVDSDPDTNPNNDNGGVPNSPTDDLITDDGTTDEDDHDPSTVVIIVPADPDGYIYCDKTGKLVTGGTISVSGPGAITIIKDGSDGSYQFFTDGTPGTYSISYNHPDGYPISTACPAQSDTLDLTVTGTPYTVGTVTLDSTGMFMDTLDCGANPWYEHIYFGIGDTLVFGNNIPVQCVFIGSIVCEDADHDDVSEPGDPGFPGMTVYLYNCADTLNPIDTAITNGLGEYAFDGLTAGDYRLQFVLPGGGTYRPTFGSNVDAAGFSPCITLAWSECDTAEYLCMFACPVVDAGADETICYGDTVQMQASVLWGSGNFSWTPGTSLSDSTLANPLAFPTNTTHYLVSYDDGLGCNQEADSVSVYLFVTTPYLTYTPFAVAVAECDDPRPFEAPVFADDCDNSLTITLDSTVLDGACDLQIIRTWTATNDQGNSAIFVQAVIMIDTVAPVITASHPLFGAILDGDTLYADCSQIASLDSMAFSSFDNCGVPAVTFWENVTYGDCDVDGYLELRYCGWTSTDSCGNTDSLFFTVIVTDTTPPVLTASHPTFGAILDGDTLYADCSQLASLDSLAASSFDDCGTPTVNFLEIVTLGDCPVDSFIQSHYLGWTSTDSCGNTDSLFFTVLIFDNLPPALSPAPADTTVVCAADIPPPAVLIPSDLCDTSLTVVVTQDTIFGSPGDCFWQLQYIWSVSDDCNNSVSVSQIITVSDTMPPILSGIPADTIISCSASLPPLPAGVNASDNCGSGVLLQFVQDTLGNPGNCTWQVRRTWTATDACDNSSSGFYLITVTDTTAPDFNPACQLVFDFFTSSGAACPGSADISLTEGQSISPTESWSVGGVSLPPLAGCLFDDCSPEDSLTAIAASILVSGDSCTRTFTVRFDIVDKCGNVSNSQFVCVANIHDDVPPTLLAVPSDTTVACAEDVPAPAILTATDDCTANMNVLLTQDTLGNPALCPWQIVRTWEVSDSCGNSTSVSQIITIQDTVPPTLDGVPADTFVECDDALPPVPDVTSSDNCAGLVQVTFVQDTLGNPNDCNWQVRRTWTATDACGNQTSGFQIINRTDLTPPVLAGVPADSTVMCGSTPPPVPTVTASDNCDVSVAISYSADTTSAACGSQIVRTWIGEDNCGNRDTMSQTILVSSENVPPTIDGVPADTTVICEELPPVPTVTASDNCDANPTLSFNQTEAGGCPNVITRTWTATDACGNPATASYDITIIDTQAPVITPTHPVLIGLSHDDTLFVECNTVPAVTAGSATVTDACCATPTLTFHEFVSLGDCQTDDYFVVMHCGWIAEDCCGNRDSFFFYVVVSDHTPPSFHGVPADVTVACNGTVPAVPTVFASDNCDNFVPVSFSETTVPDACGYQILRTWSATDDCGNAGSATQTITVIQETIPPNIYNVPANTTADCDSLPPVDGGVVAGDNCDTSPSLTFSETQVGSGCNYQLVRTWTATDACGNSNSASQIINVSDNEPPTLTGIVLEDTINCGDSIPPAAYVASDDCDTSVTVNIFTVYNYDDPCGFVINRVYQAVDDCGNQYAVHQHIHVLDNVAPEITVTDPDLIGVAHGDTLTFGCTDAPVLDVNEAFATDLCSGVDTIYRTEQIWQTDCGTDGHYLLMQCGWEAIDSCGNVGEWFVFFRITDTVAPVLQAVPADITVDCNSIPPADLLTATDLCDDSVSVTVADAVIGAGCPYTIIRTWTATDHCGNTATDSQIITVSDTVAPVLIGLPPATMTAECGSEPLPPVVTATDNCDTGLAVIFDEIFSASATCPDTITRTWVVYDDCGNADFFMQTIFVDDTQLPVFDQPLPADTTVQCDNMPIPAVLTATDLCDLSGLVVRNDSVGTGCPYQIFRTWTATDDCGNEATHTQILTVIDTVAPVVSEPADTTVFCENIPASLTPIASDNCDFSLLPVFNEQVDTLTCGYEILRTWTFTDDCGNATTVDQLVTVTDTTAPALVFTHPLLAGLTDGDTLVMECHEAEVFDENSAAAVDSCSSATVTFIEDGITSGFCPVDGYIVIMNCTWVATDACGNETSVTLHMRIEDNTPPLLSGLPGDTTILCNEVIPPCVTPTVSDECGNASILFSTTDSIPTANGYDLVCSWTAVDDCGNVAVDTQVIHVENAGDPILSDPPADTLINLGQGQSVPPFGIVVALDACTLDTLPVQTREEIFLDSNGCDTIIVRTWFVEDNGDTVSVSQTITVIFGGYNISVAATAPDTCGFGVGSAILTPDTLIYAWSDGGFGDMRNDLSAGSYTVIATNDNGCPDTLTVFIGEVCPCVPAVLDSISTTGASCGVSDGSATVHLAGDEANYEYFWLPNFGTPVGDGNARTGLPAGNYIVFVLWQGQDSCVEKYPVNVFDNCPKCPPVFQQETLALTSPQAPAGVCLPVPLGISQGSQIYVDGNLFTGNLTACDYEDAVVYNYSQITGGGQTGLYDLSWHHDGTVLHTLVNNMDELAGAMNSVDPAGGWMNLAASQKLISANTGGNYGKISITHVPSNASWLLQKTTSTSPVGTRINLPPGDHLLVYSQNGLCNDTLLLTVKLAPEHPAEIVSEDLLVTQRNCDLGGDLGVCIEIAYAELSQYDIEVNGADYQGQIGSCDYLDAWFYTFANLPGSGSNGSFELKNWSVNGQVFTGTFQNIGELIGLMNQWDTHGSWSLDAGTFSIKGGSPGSQYGSLKIFESATGTVTTLELNSSITPGSTSMLLTEGINQIVFTRLDNGLKDTLTAVAACVSPDYVKVTVKVGESDTLHLPTDELYAQPVSLTNATPAGLDEASTLLLVEQKRMVHFTGLHVGERQATLVFCDQYGICDTTYLTIEVREDFSTQLVTDTIQTVMNQSVTADVVANDLLAGDVVSNRIIQGAHHGIVEITANRTVTYTPSPDYCNSGNGDELDHFYYEVCLSDGTCHTMIVYVEVLCDELVIHNGFSPNGDGVNDYFRIDGLQKFPNHKLTIFNRWGNLVFKTKDYQNDWGGSWNSNNLPDGTYFYMLEDGEGKQYKGYLQVRR